MNIHVSSWKSVQYVGCVIWGIFDSRYHGCSLTSNLSQEIPGDWAGF